MFFISFKKKKRKKKELILSLIVSTSHKFALTLLQEQTCMNFKLRLGQPTSKHTHPLQTPPRYVIIFTSLTLPYLVKKSRISFSST